MIERATLGVPHVPTREERERRFTAAIEALVPPDELALRRKHGRGLQGGLFRDPRAYAEEAAATAHIVTQEDYENANS